MEILVLGSGSCDPSAERGCAGYVLKFMGKTFLIDAGPGTHRQLCKMGIGFESIDEIFITHFHVDHVGDLAAVLFTMIHGLAENERGDLVIHGPVGFEENFNSLTELYGKQIVPKNFSITVKEHGEDFEPEEKGKEKGKKEKVKEETGKDGKKEEEEKEDASGSIVVSSLPVKHSLNAIAYRFDNGHGKALVYSGDTEPCENLLMLAKNAQCLLMECSTPDEAPIEGHSTTSQAAETAKNANVKVLVLTHIKPSNDTTDLDQKAAKIFDGTVFVAYDGMRITI